MDYSINRDGNNMNITMQGRFTFEDNQKFRSILNSAEDSTVSAITLDMKEISYMDSAAIGMLLLLHDSSKEHSVNVALTNTTGQVKKVLEISNLQQIFSIK